MAVPEQTPYKEFTANGVTKIFPLEFDVLEQDHLIVLVNDIEPIVGSWSLDILNDAVVFGIAPINGANIKIRRNTPLERSTDYKTYNASFNPPSVNTDFDNIWRKLQEMGVLNWMVNNDVKDLNDYVDSLNEETRNAFLADIQKQGISLNQLKVFTNQIYQNLANVAVSKGWFAEFVTDGVENQKKINDETVRNFESIADLKEYSARKDGQVVNVKSFYKGHNRGGGEFSWHLGATDPLVNGFVIDGVGSGRWKRKILPQHSIDDFGASPLTTRDVNSLAIAISLSFLKSITIPKDQDYLVDFDKIAFYSGNRLSGGGRLIGPDPDLKKADVSGSFFRIDNCEDVKIDDVIIKNGYKGKGVWMTNSRNIEFNNFEVDGFSYGMWIGESDDGVGCQNIRINKPRILNTKYWGMYIRCLEVTDTEKLTQDIKVTDPYFYNCNMAGFVCAEGHVRYVSLVNPTFRRCNVNMHFETTTDYEVINPRDFETGKKPDHIPANTEYPYENWSMYHAFTQRGKITGGTLELSCYHYAADGGGSEDIQYIGTTVKDFIFEGGGYDVNKVFFKNYTFNGCTTKGVFLYQLGGAENYLRDFKIFNSTCLLGKDVATGAGNGNLVAIYAPRTVNFKVDGSTIYNACLRITGYGLMSITKNTFIGGTNNTQSKFDGVNGSQLSGNILEFSGNMFERAGGSVIGESAFLISNFARVRADNQMRTTCNYGYRFTNNYRVEYGGSDVLGWVNGAYANENITNFVKLFSTT